MKYDWILDVLADLKAFSAANGLTALAEELDEVNLLAATEISTVLAKEQEALSQAESERTVQ